MFDYIVPSDAGIYVRENKKFKFSKTDFDTIYGKMSKEGYNRRTYVKI